MSLQLIIAAIIAAIGFGSGWQLQSWRYGAREADRAKQELVQVQASAASSIRRADNVIAAQNRATARASDLRRDAGAASDELRRLRSQLASVPRGGDTPEACPDTGPTLRELLDSCAGELVEVAGKADRHASDAQALTDAWPK